MDNECKGALFFSFFLFFIQVSYFLFNRKKNGTYAFYQPKNISLIYILVNKIHLLHHILYVYMYLKKKKIAKLWCAILVNHRLPLPVTRSNHQREV